MKRSMLVAVLVLIVGVAAPPHLEARVDSEQYQVSLGCYDDTFVTISNENSSGQEAVECRGDGSTSCYASSSPTCYIKQLTLTDLNGVGSQKDRTPVSQNLSPLAPSWSARASACPNSSTSV